MAPFRCLLVALGCIPVGADLLVQSKNPVQSTVQLLERLQKTIQNEGRAEAAAYDKFACFCKEQADEKSYSIAKKTARIGELGAKVKKLTAQISDFTGKMEKSQKHKAGLEQESKEALAKNVEDHEAYLKSRADRKKGIEDLKKAKKVVAKGADATDAAAALLLQLKREDPAAYESKSGSTLELLEKLEKQFILDLKRTDADEVERKHEVMMEDGARQNEIMATENMIRKCESIIGKKTSAKTTAEDEKGNLENDKEEDHDYLMRVTEQCEDKAVKWDARSKRRYEELSAVSECMRILKKGFAAVQKEKAVKAGKAPTLLQLASSSTSDAPKVAAQKAINALVAKASSLKSAKITALVMELQTSPFDSVKGMIQDLIDKIDAEQGDEEAEIADCKTDIMDATSKKASMGAKVEAEEAELLQHERAIREHKDNGKDLAKAISESFKALKEASTLRATEKKENARALADANAGEEALKAAIKVMDAFYGLQVGASPKDVKKTPIALAKKAVAKSREDPAIPAGDDFLGGNADDPSDPSRGNEGTGIIGLLNTIKGDYTSSVATIESDEEDAEGEFQTFKTMTEGQISSKKDELADAKRSQLTAEDGVESSTNDIESYKTQNTEAVHELSILKPRCLGLGASAKQRKERRESEKAALNEAIAIISAMSPA